MKNNKLKVNKLFLVILTLVLYFLISYFLNLTPSSSAQASPQFLVSWQAQNYVPSWYQGKILAVNGTPVSISFELVDGGKIADLSKTIIRWYVNDDLVRNENNGLGIKNLKINIPDSNGGQTNIRIAVVGYRCGDLIDKILEIPVVGPEAIINAPYPNKAIKIGLSNFGVNPFFFNISDIDNLLVNWSVNGQAPANSNNPYLLSLNIGSDTPQNTQINISVSVKNILKSLEFASQSIQLQVK